MQYWHYKLNVAKVHSNSAFIPARAAEKKRPITAPSFKLSNEIVSISANKTTMKAEKNVTKLDIMYLFVVLLIVLLN